jgi:hypothetical protein
MSLMREIDEFPQLSEIPTEMRIKPLGTPASLA